MGLKDRMKVWELESIGGPVTVLGTLRRRNPGAYVINARLYLDPKSTLYQKMLDYEKEFDYHED